MKNVPIYPNNQLDNACLQSCVKGILDYFKRSDQIANVDKNTGYHADAFSWIPQTVNWLSSLGFEVSLYTPGNYDSLSIDGIEYLKTIKGDIFEFEEARGDYKYIDELQEASKLMIKNNLWIKESLSDIRLAQALTDNYTLAIGKTVSQWLSGYYETNNPTTHWVNVINEFSQGIWRINDPGLPPIQNRTVQKMINGNRILIGEILLITSRKL